VNWCYSYRSQSVCFWRLYWEWFSYLSSARFD